LIPEVKKAKQGVRTILLRLFKKALGLFDYILRETIRLRKVGAASNMLEAPFAPYLQIVDHCPSATWMECHEQQNVVQSS